MVLVVVLAACSGASDSSGEVTVDETSTTTDSAAEASAGSAPPASGSAVVADEAPPASTEADTSPTEGAPATTDGLSPPGDQGGQALGPLGETEAEFETEDGTVQIGGGEVPDDASRLPLPDDFTVKLSSETPTALGFTGTTALPFAEVVALFEEGLEAAGFEVTDQSVTAEVFAVFGFESDTEEGNVVVATTPGSDDITITLALADR